MEVRPVNLTAGYGKAAEPVPQGPVLCAVDLGDGSGAVIRSALEAAAAGPGSPGMVVILHVVARTPAAAIPRYAWRFMRPSYAHYLQLSARRRLQALIPSRARLDGQTRALVLTGHAGTEIVATAHELRARAIVLGVSQRGALARRLFGSTADVVAPAVECPVLIVPAAARVEHRAERQRPAA